MNHLLAKTKGKRGDYFKVISNKKIFDIPDSFNNSVEYDSNYKLEEDEWFVISEFSTKEYCLDFLKSRFISTDYNQLTRSDYTNIEFLIAYQSEKYCFQKISTSQIIQKKYISTSISDQPNLLTSPIIIINQFPDAIYVKGEDKLYFNKLSSITSIFNGIYDLFKEATQEETQLFLANEFIKLESDFSVNQVKTANRKRIAMAQETLKKYNPKDKIKIFNYIREYCNDLEFDENEETFSIANEDDLKKLLYGIEQRYYTTSIGNEKRLANSIITI
jgi:hypothetical protein